MLLLTRSQRDRTKQHSTWLPHQSLQHAPNMHAAPQPICSCHIQMPYSSTEAGRLEWACLSRGCHNSCFPWQTMAQAAPINPMIQSGEHPRTMATTCTITPIATACSHTAREDSLRVPAQPSIPPTPLTTMVTQTPTCYAWPESCHLAQAPFSVDICLQLKCSVQVLTSIY